jgi:hypothetical protein
MGFFSKSIPAVPAPVPGQGSIGSNFTGGISQPDGSTIWYIGGQESPVPYHTAMIAVGRSGILNGPDSAKVIQEDSGSSQSCEGLGYIPCGTF